jgi:hypothetical protein
MPISHDVFKIVDRTKYIARQSQHQEVFSLDRRIGTVAQRSEREAALRTRLKELAAKRMLFGYRQLTAMLVREGMAAKP